MERRFVLVIDDDDAIRVVLYEALTREGYEVACAKDGLDALRLLRRAKRTPRLVLVDLVMPGMDGEQVLEVLKREGMLKDTKVVRLTAVPGPPADVLEKPLELERLLRTMRKAA
jgi:CheY-like chemotaxis protein